MKHIDYKGISITLEYEKGSYKPDKHATLPDSGWYMYADYGFIDNTVSMEPGDALDVFVGDLPDCDEVYWFELLDRERAVFDEYKLCLGYESAAKAYELLCWQYGSDRIGPVLVTSLDGLKEVIQQGRLSYEKGEALKGEDSEDAVPLEEAREIMSQDRDIQEMSAEGFPMLKSLEERPLQLVLLIEG